MASDGVASGTPAVLAVTNASPDVKIKAPVTRKPENMASVKDFKKKHLCCSVCLETFRTPRILPCAHTFCQSCLDPHIQKSKSVYSLSFECPMCRVRIYPDNIHSPVCDWAQEFPLNHLIVSMLEDTAKPFIDNALSEPLDDGEECGMKCTPCERQDKQEDVFCFCVNCCEYLCAECYSHHSKFKLMRSHDILKGGAIPKDASMFRIMSEMILCAEHNDREVEFKCLIHDEFICSTCVKIGTHTDCPVVESLAKLSDTYTATTLIERMLSEQNELCSLKNEVENVLHRKENDLEDLSRKASHCVDQRQTIVAELRRLINYYEKLPYKDVEESAESEQAKMRACISDCTSLIDVLSKGYELVDAVVQYGSAKQTLITTDKLKQVNETVKSEFSVYLRTEPDLSSGPFLSDEETMRLKSLKTLLDTRLGINSDDRTTGIARTVVDGHATVGDSVDAGAIDGDENIDFGSDEYIGLPDIEKLFNDEMNQ